MLYPRGKEPPVPVGWEAATAPELVWTLWKKEKSLFLPKSEPQFSTSNACLKMNIVIWGVTPCSLVHVYGVTFRKRVFLVTVVRSSNLTRL
jgi:hypothetical protein